MNIPENIVDCILNAEGKALGTSLSGVINVVPVSTVKVVDDKILLVNYFLNKTLKNIQENPSVSFTCWRGLEGYQIKASVEHITEGDLFEDIKKWVGEILPDRTVRGVLVLTPTEMFDVTATIEVPGVKI